MKRSAHLLALLASGLAVGGAARRAAAQTQDWGAVPAPAPAPPAQPPPTEGGGVGLQVLAGVGIGAAAVGTMFALYALDSRAGGYAAWGLVGLTPAAVGMAVCSLGQPSEKREPSCPRAVIAAYIGSLIAVPVALVAFVSQIDWGTGPNPQHEHHAEVVIYTATSIGWVGGMTLGAVAFGRRRLRPPAYSPPPPPSPWPAGFAPADDPHQPRWAGVRSSGQLVFRLLSVEF